MVRTSTVVIIGGGPAGISAAIQLSRYRIPVVLFEKNALGGLLKNAHRVDNYPGFPRGISGKKLSSLMKSQCERINIPIIYENLIELDYEHQEFFAKSVSHRIQCPIAVLASGTKPKKLNHDSWPQEIKNKIHYEIFPMKRLKNKDICIIGAGDAAFDYALSLSAGNRITIFNRTRKIRCLPVLKEEVEENKKIRYMPERILKNINVTGNRLFMTFFHKKKEELHEFDEIFAAVGRSPVLDFLSQRLQKNMDYLIECGKLYLTGDVKKKRHRQAAIACGDGLETAMKIHTVLCDPNHKELVQK